MCGDLDEENTQLERLYNAFLHAARSAIHDAVDHHGGSRGRLDRQPAPLPDDPRHAAFTEEVKLEPFARAIAELKPEVWFTALREEQTAFRAGLAPVTLSKEGILKVSPVFHWSSKRMHEYLQAHGLPNNFDYYDPTKVEDKRECGLHMAH